MKNEDKSKDGLPEVAQNLVKKNPIMLIMMGVAIILVLCMYLHSKPNKEIKKPIEETYTVAADPQIDIKKEVIQTSAAIPSKEVIRETQEHMVLLQEKQKELQQRLSAPLMLVNAQQSASSAPSGAPQAQSGSKDPNTQFMNQVATQSVETSTATTIGPLNSVIAEGSLIHAILEPATNSDLPGYLRAIVSEPSYAEDGTQILIPRGTRLIGQYKSGMLQGQSRIFIVWSRLITPAGISLNLGSPGVDSLGVSGMAADEIDRHFWQRFGTASLLSLLGAGAANAGVKGQDEENSSSAYRTAVASSFSQSANQSLEQESQIAPTLKSHQGKPIMVFVARDLHFQSAMKTVKPKINLF
ncbi:MAG: TraB/TrbI/VirB10 family type IV secretion system protein [Gammaproteobacteria bacterium]